MKIIKTELNEIMKTFQDMRVKIVALKKTQTESEKLRKSNKNLRGKLHQQITRHGRENFMS